MIVLQKLVEEIAVSLWDTALEFFERKATFLAPDVLLWNDQVDAEGFASALSGEHLQCLIELLWLHTGGFGVLGAAGMEPQRLDTSLLMRTREGAADSLGIDLIIPEQHVGP